MIQGRRGSSQAAASGAAKGSRSIQASKQGHGPTRPLMSHRRAPLAAPHDHDLQSWRDWQKSLRK